MAPAGNLKRVFTGKSGQNRKKNFGRVMYASETIQNCKNPTGHIDTLRFWVTIEDVVDVLPGLLSWMVVGVQITLQWESSVSQS